MDNCLLLLDTVGIKKYIFATRFLKEIRGASALLDELNRNKMEELIHQIAPDAESIYANGGAGMFIVPAASVKEIADAVSTAYKSIDAHITTAWIPYNEEWSNYKQDYCKLIYQADQNRYQSHTVSKITHAFFRDCDSNKNEYAIVNPDLENEKNRKLLSYAAYKKRKYNFDLKQAMQCGKLKPNTLWHKLNTTLTDNGYPDLKELDFPENFEDIARFDPQKYIAMIYADGNDMGKTLINEITSFDDLSKFSNKIDDAIYKATALAVHCNLTPSREMENGSLPFDILLLGGDDLVMVVPASKAFDVAIKIGEEFQRLSGKSLCIGVAIAHDKYPIHSLLHITEDLLKHAKKERARRLVAENRNANKAVNGMIHYRVLQQSCSVDWQEYKRENFEYKEEAGFYNRTCRPYTFDDLKLLINLGKRLKESRFPNNKLQFLYDAVFKNSNQCKIDTLFLLTRFGEQKGQEKQKELLYELFILPAQLAGKESISEENLAYCKIKQNNSRVEYRTAILDLVEILNFITGDKEAGNNAE